MKRWTLRGLGCSTLVAAILTGSSLASASLTTSEKGTIKDAIAAAQPSQAARVRSLVARPDLTPEETEEALRGALEGVHYDEARSAFVRELAFGASSAASRPTLTPPLVGALLARADRVLAQRPFDARAGAEASFVYAEIARLTGGSRAIDPQLPRAAADVCAKKVATHVEKNARLLKLDQTISKESLRARSQLALAAWALAREGPTARVDFADAFGMTGGRRALFVERGLLVLDTGKADEARVAHVRALVDRVPLLREGAGAVAFGDPAPSLVSRLDVVALPSDLESSAVLPGPWGEEVEPGPVDPVFANTALELARWLTARALKNRVELRAAAQEDLRLADAPRPFGAVADATPEAAVAAAVHLLLLDAPRALDWALARSVAGQPRSVALLSDALGVLASFARPQAGGLAISLGKPRPDASQEGIAATEVRLSPQGSVTSMRLGGHVFAFERTGPGALGAITRDGAAVTLAVLPAARAPLTAEGPWAAGPLSFARLRGTPGASATPGPRLRMVARGTRGYDAIAARAPADDFVLEADLSVTGGQGGIGVRTTLARDALRGARIVLDAAGPYGPRVALVSTDEVGQEAYMSAPVDAPFTSPTHVKVVVRGTKIEAEVGGAKLWGTLPETTARGGEVVLWGKSGASVDTSALSIKPLTKPTARR